MQGVTSVSASAAVAVIARKYVDLNSASIDEIASLPMVGRHLAAELILHRPFQSWTQIRKVPGFSPGLVDILKNGQARLG